MIDHGVCITECGIRNIKYRLKKYTCFLLSNRGQVYQVVHEGVVKAAKKTNLARLGVGRHGVDRVFKRFVKELYILSQMHSERCDGSDSTRRVDGMNVVHWCTVVFRMGGIRWGFVCPQQAYQCFIAPGKTSTSIQHNHRSCPLSPSPPKR